MSNRRDIQFFYTPHNKATLLDDSFVVDVANGNGLGLRSLKPSGRIASVFMHSTASFVGSTHSDTTVTAIAGGTASLLPGMPIQGSGIPAGTVIASITSSSAIVMSASASTSVAGGTITYQGVGNPNPPAGYIITNLSDNYNRYLYGGVGIVSPVSGTPILVASAGTVANTVYIIVSLGTTTTAAWHTLGVSANVDPAVGVAFVASATTTVAGTGAVEVIKSTGSGIDHIEAVGDANLMNSNGAYTTGTSTGMQIFSVCFNQNAVTAPADGTVLANIFYMNNSAFGV